MNDAFGRRFTYLRLSITDACNFRCIYCLPNGYRKTSNSEDYLSLSEISNLVSAFAELGIWKIRLTGGEPTLRRDILQIAECIAATQGIKKIALSTNGYRLKEIGGSLIRSGVQNFNISLDSLCAERFKAITGSDQLDKILGGIDSLLSTGKAVVKVNVVLMKSGNESETPAFIEWVRNKPITVRWIEMMPTGLNQDAHRAHHSRSESLKETLTSLGWVKQSRFEADGPAEEYSHPDYVGRVGLIAPYQTGFCGSCNRLRVTSLGLLRLCLFGKGGHSLRDFLQSKDQKPALKCHILDLLKIKPLSHELEKGEYGDNRTFSAMGG